jgi:tetratricopeptide (TPR) repeat protein
METKETAYIERLRELWPMWPDEIEAPRIALLLIEEAVKECPNSAQLWCMRGDFIQVSPDDMDYDLLESLYSYSRAMEIDPAYSDAFESIGYYYDVIRADPASAEKPFRKAIEFGTGYDSYVGLARVLAQLDRRREAIQWLSADKCPFHDQLDIRLVRDEITEGSS